MANKTPTNNDIVKLITMQHQDVSGRLDAIEEQVKYTNGKVRALTEWKNAQDAVEKYKRDQASVQTRVKVETNGWDWKVVLAILLTLATTAAAVAGVIHN